MIGSTTGIYAARLLGGFSLVELLVVIVIIAILAAISIVFYANVREQAQATAVIAGRWRNLLPFEGLVGE